jgi:hypothetical protein
MHASSKVLGFRIFGGNLPIGKLCEFLGIRRIGYSSQGSPVASRYRAPLSDTSTERINSQSKELGIKRPNVRNIDSVRNLTTLTYLVINARALRGVRQVNASLLRRPVKRVA